MPRLYQPLNRTLYNRLLTLFGRVVIANQGQAWAGHTFNECGRTRWFSESAGEYYRVDCPFCIHGPGKQTDAHRARLWINHVFGIPDARGDNRYWAAKCFHNDCLERNDNRRQLSRMVWADFTHGNRQAVEILEGEPPEVLPEIAELPGTCIPIKDLPPHHMAVEYLASRGMDPYYLATRYDLQFCLEPPPGPGKFGLRDRIIIPVVMHGKLATWQARYTGNTDFKRTNIPKYLNQTGGRKSQCLYDFDAARTVPFVTIVESAPTCWWLGTGVVAILGKSASAAQLQLLKSNWSAAVIALDADAYYSAEDTYVRLASHMPVVKLLLEKGQDPGEMPQEHFWDLVYQAASKQNVSLPI